MGSKRLRRRLVVAPSPQRGSHGNGGLFYYPRKLRLLQVLYIDLCSRAQSSAFWPHRLLAVCGEGCSRWPGDWTEWYDGALGSAARALKTEAYYATRLP
jgi:hypothetical protein